MFVLADEQPTQVGNLSFYTTEEQIYELFSKCTNPEDGGGIKRIIMGLDRNTRYAPDNFRILVASTERCCIGRHVDFVLLSTTVTLRH